MWCYDVGGRSYQVGQGVNRLLRWHWHCRRLGTSHTMPMKNAGYGWSHSFCLRGWYHSVVLDEEWCVVEFLWQQCASRSSSIGRFKQWCLLIAHGRLKMRERGTMETLTMHVVARISAFQLNLFVPIVLRYKYSRYCYFKCVLPFKLLVVGVPPCNYSFTFWLSASFWRLYSWRQRRFFISCHFWRLSVVLYIWFCHGCALAETCVFWFNEAVLVCWMSGWPWASSQGWRSL
jgi:hypothetical protein